jgi:hypothetical protein
MVRNIRYPKANQAHDIVSEIGRPLSAARNAPVNTLNTAGKGRDRSSFRDAPPELGFTEFGIIIVQVGNSRLECADPESSRLAVSWIPGSREDARPGMTALEPTAGQAALQMK